MRTGGTLAVLAAAVALTLGGCAADQTSAPMPTDGNTDDSREDLANRMVDICREDLLADIPDKGTVDLDVDIDSLDFVSYEEPHPISAWSVSGTIESAATDRTDWLCRVFPDQTFPEEDESRNVDGIGAVLVDTF